MPALEHHGEPDPWRAFAFFTRDGRCIANVDAAILPLIIDGERTAAGAIRSVAVDAGWRGRGLFRTLMDEALKWCDARSSGVTLLYTAEPPLYRGFGFRPVPQHAFVEAAPAPKSCPPARRLVPARSNDSAFIRASVARRAPASLRCSLMVEPALFAANIAADDEFHIAHDAEHRAVIVYESDDNILTIVDVVAPVMPDLASILGALAVAPLRIKTQFPPDRLGWHGEPVAEETGLMARGPLPSAMTRPFMFPPTAEF